MTIDWGKAVLLPIDMQQGFEDPRLAATVEP